MKKITFSRKLLDRYLGDKSTGEEKSIVEGWFNKELNDNEYPISEGELKDTEDKIWMAIQAHQKISSNRPIHRKIKLWQIMAGAAASIVLIAFLVLYQMNKSGGEPVEYTTVMPVKENKLIQLPDGSMVIIDKGSKIRFAKSFEGQPVRKVYLSGKAFFDIKHKPSQPFVVYSGKIKTTVLGTAFDIVANPGSDEVIVRVIRGKVNVSNDKGTLADLLPNRKITYHVRKAKSVISSVDAGQEMVWTRQDMLLNDITFEAICIQLEKRYQVKISIMDEHLKLKKFTISLTANENLDNFLATICDFNDARYRYDKASQTFVITAKN